MSVFTQFVLYMQDKIVHHQLKNSAASQRLWWNGDTLAFDNSVS